MRASIETFNRNGFGKVKKTYPSDTVVLASFLHLMELKPRFDVKVLPC